MWWRTAARSTPASRWSSSSPKRRCLLVNDGSWRLCNPALSRHHLGRAAQGWAHRSISGWVPRARTASSGPFACGVDLPVRPLDDECGSAGSCNRATCHLMGRAFTEVAESTQHPAQPACCSFQGSWHSPGARPCTCTVQLNGAPVAQEVQLLHVKRFCKPGGCVWHPWIASLHPSAGRLQCFRSSNFHSL